MKLKDFRIILKDKEPPGKLSSPLKALWHDANGDWELAHRIVQDIPSTQCAWVHAYLHRKEGDIGNALYWYNQAGKKRPEKSLQKEWQEIVVALLRDEAL